MKLGVFVSDFKLTTDTLARYGIPEDALPDAEDMGADKKLQIVPYSEIQKAIEESKHVMPF